MDSEKLLRDLVRAIEREEPTGFFWRDGGTFCPAGCRTGGLLFFSDHRPDCPFRLAVEALDGREVTKYHCRGANDTLGG